LSKTKAKAQLELKSFSSYQYN